MSYFIQFNINKLANRAAYCSFICIFWMLIVLIINSLSYIFKINIISYSFIFSVVVSVSLSYFLSDVFQIKKKDIIFFNLFFIAFLAVGIYLSSIVYDVSYDGLSYHKQAVIQLWKGYNPFHETVEGNILDSVFINHYPKAAWQISTSVVSFTGALESGKLINFTFTASAFFALLSVLLISEKFSVLLSVVISLLAILNPIMICQTFTSCVDGVLACLFLTMLCGLYLIIFCSRKTIGYCFATCSVIIISNVKFTGLVYAGIIIFMSVILFLLINGIKGSIKYLSIVTVWFVLAVLFIGFNPYVLNTALKHYPFYPINEINVLEGSSPVKFEKMNRFERFFASTFSESDNVFPPRRNFIKRPFTIRYDPEVGIFKENDVRIGGFGPLFSGAVLSVTGIYLIYLIIIRKNTRIFWIEVFCIASIMFTVFIHDAGWWARFVPQFYLLLVLLLIFVLSADHKWLKYICILPFLILIINSVLILKSNWSNTVVITRQVNAQMAYFKSLHRPIYIRQEGRWFHGLDATIQRLKENGVNFKLVDNFAGKGYIETGELINGKKEIMYGYEIPEKTAIMKEATFDDYLYFLSWENKQNIGNKLTDGEKEDFLLFQNVNYNWDEKDKIRKELLLRWIKYKGHNLLY